MSQGPDRPWPRALPQPSPLRRAAQDGHAHGCPLCPREVGLMEEQGGPRRPMRQALGRKGWTQGWGSAPRGEVWAVRGKECGGRREAGAGPAPTSPLRKSPLSARPGAKASSPRKPSLVSLLQ